MMTTAVATDSSINFQTVTPAQQSQEHAWAVAAQRGDEAAFMLLVEAYQKPVYNLCYRMLNDPVEAEDAAQETFIRVYTKIHSYNPNRKLSSWVLSIASHYCIDKLRKRRFQLVSWDELPTWNWFTAKEPEPEPAALTKEQRLDMQAVVNALPPDYRAAIILRYWHEMSYDEIAETLNTTVSTIKSRLFRARKMMANLYSSAEETV